MATQTDRNVPVHTIRHRRIKVAIWENQTAKGPMHAVSVTRSFKKDDVWKDTHSFTYDDLPIVAKLLNDAHSAISALIVRAKTPAAKPAGPKRGS